MGFLRLRVYSTSSRGGHIFYREACWQWCPRSLGNEYFNLPFDVGI